METPRTNTIHYHTYKNNFTLPCIQNVLPYCTFVILYITSHTKCFTLPHIHNTLHYHKYKIFPITAHTKYFSLPHIQNISHYSTYEILHKVPHIQNILHYHTNYSTSLYIQNILLLTFPHIQKKLQHTFVQSNL